ncbi:MAG: hypothetical protein Q7T79_00545 [bacterium]|nr:hypothetical protein [bacterium]
MFIDESKLIFTSEIPNLSDANYLQTIITATKFQFGNAINFIFAIIFFACMTFFYYRWATIHWKYNLLNFGALGHLIPIFCILIIVISVFCLLKMNLIARQYQNLADHPNSFYIKKAQVIRKGWRIASTGDVTYKRFFWSLSDDQTKKGKTPFLIYCDVFDIEKGDNLYVAIDSQNALNMLFLGFIKGEVHRNNKLRQKINERLNNSGFNSDL